MHDNRIVYDELYKKISSKIVASIKLLQESFTGTLKRCVAHLEINNNGQSVDHETIRASRALREFLNVAYEVYRDLDYNLRGFIVCYT